MRRRGGGTFCRNLRRRWLQKMRADALAPLALRRRLDVRRAFERRRRLLAVTVAVVIVVVIVEIIAINAVEVCSCFEAFFVHS